MIKRIFPVFVEIGDKGLFVDAQQFAKRQGIHIRIYIAIDYIDVVQWGIGYHQLFIAIQDHAP